MKNWALTLFFYTMYYLCKHTSFKQNIINDFGKYAKELFDKYSEYCTEKKAEFIKNNFTEGFAVQIFTLFGTMCYYGIPDLIKRDKEKAFNYFKKAYKEAKEKKLPPISRENYVFIYKCRKYLYKNNKITLKKLNKTKEKLFLMYENVTVYDLDELELYNFYKLFKVGVYGKMQEKLIKMLERGKEQKSTFHFQNIVYREKCKLAY